MPSLSKERYEPVGLPFDERPRVEVEGDADALADALGPEAEGVSSDQGLLYLPLGWKDVPTLLGALAKVAGAMRKPREAFFFQAGANLCVAELERGVGVRLRPAWLWVEEGTDEDRAAFERVLRLPEPPRPGPSRAMGPSLALAHQRELVRASLIRCPDRSDGGDRRRS